MWKLEHSARRPDRAKRTAEVEIRIGTTEIARRLLRKIDLAGAVRPRLVEVKEITRRNPPIPSTGSC